MMWYRSASIATRQTWAPWMQRITSISRTYSVRAAKPNTMCMDGTPRPTMATPWSPTPPRSRSQIMSQTAIWIPTGCLKMVNLKWPTTAKRSPAKTKWRTRQPFKKRSSSNYPKCSIRMARPSRILKRDKLICKANGLLFPFLCPHPMLQEPFLWHSNRTAQADKTPNSSWTSPTKSRPRTRELQPWEPSNQAS